jgi:predicted Fe-Mo cluster-binding NifX family protein
MNIAVIAEGNSLDSDVAQQFASCKCLLIVNMPDMSFTVVKNEPGGSGETLAKKVLDFDCEAVISGLLPQAEFDILADAYITRYVGYGHSVRAALFLMDKDLLRLMKTADGANSCEGDHIEEENDSCEGKHH